METFSLQSVRSFFEQLQDTISESFEKEEGGAKFIKDEWVKPNGEGGGVGKILRNGDVFEQAGVNFSFVQGDSLPTSASAQRPELAGCSFHAMGVSVVVHPHNPYVPTSHMNVRFFKATKPGKKPIWWFGGGFDLTPYYGFEQDAYHWHQMAHDACAPFGDGVYQEFKHWCDEYFCIKHRGEQRGIGGLFFDDLNRWDFSISFEFVKRVGQFYLQGYLPIVASRKLTPFGERERQFQLYRRGRYVEFNLIYDRGTLFGLQSGGRVQSILMSLPPLARWECLWEAEPNSPEARLVSDFLLPRDWI